MKRTANASAWLCCVMMSLLSGCQLPAAPDASGSQSPTVEQELRTMRLRDLGDPIEVPADRQVRAEVATSRIVVRRIIVPHEPEALKNAFALLVPPPIDPLHLQQWDNNGFRYGVLEARQWSEFTSLLPRRTVGGQLELPIPAVESILLRKGVFHSIPLVTQVDRDQPVHVRQPDGSRIVRRFAGGEYQLLVRIARETTDGSTLELLPHHFRRNPLLWSRHMREDPTIPPDPSAHGTSIEGLFTGAILSREQLWVISVRPDAIEPPPEQTTEGEPARREPTDVSVAEAMMAGIAEGEPSQIILIIGLQ